MVTKKTRFLSIALAVVMVFSAFAGMATDQVEAKDNTTNVLDEIVKTLGDTEQKDGLFLDGEDAMDYLTYVFLGWRNTGGDWQNQVIDEFVKKELVDAGYTSKGSDFLTSFPANTAQSPNDMSNTHDDDYVWTSYYGSNSSVWDPKYAKLNVTSTNNSAIKDFADLKSKIDVESYAFDSTWGPTIQHYNDLYGSGAGNASITSTDSLWNYFKTTNDEPRLKKDYDADLTRTEFKVESNRPHIDDGQEAELNKRTHLARNSQFTTTNTAISYNDVKSGNVPKTTGKAVYVGIIGGNASNGYTSTEYPAGTVGGIYYTATQAAFNACQGGVILSDSSLSSTSGMASWAGGVAAMSARSMYSGGVDNPSFLVPQNPNTGSVTPPFEKSARYAGGGTQAGVVNWQFSTEQRNSLIEIIKNAKAVGEDIIVENTAIGSRYPMNSNKGQAVTISEIKGASKPDERILICAHVQEPSSNDNATGVAAQLAMATKYKKMIDAGVIERPERTITFLWGDEMNMATLWMGNHAEEKADLISVLDMDMVGEDPGLTGGVMRIEKTPDPSAVYEYTLDEVPWLKDEDGKLNTVITDDKDSEGAPYYDRDTFEIVNDYNGSEGEFVRLPDSHTLWGAGSVSNLFKEGFFLNDLYMASSQSVISNHDKTFQVDVCPYEGGSDHSRFLAQNVPALLTWHFTDYTYHTTVDTLAMSSAREMENVNITTLATAIVIANATEKRPEYAEYVLDEMYNAAKVRFDKEKQNSENHAIYTEALGKDADEELVQEQEVLAAWSKWYKQAVKSVGNWLIDDMSPEFAQKEAANVRKVQSLYLDSLSNAIDQMSEKITLTFDSNGGSSVDSYKLIFGEPLKALPVPTKAGQNFAGWFTDNTFTKEVVEGDILTADVNLIAKWVDKDDMAGAVVTGHKDKVYNGKAQTHALKVTLNGKTLVEKQDYTVAYANNVNVGAAKITLKATDDGKFKGEKNVSFKINPKTTSISKVKAGKKKAVVSWKKVSGTTKYQVRYKAKGSKKWKTKTVSAKKAKLTVKKLKKGKKYQFQVRSYKTVSGVKYISAWSKTKTSKKVK